MMGNRYDKYKDSGIAWIGEIPEHWKVCKLSTLFFQHKQKNNDTQESNLLSLSYGNIKRKDINTSEGLLPESFENYNIIDKDDIVFRLTDLQNDKRSLRSALCKERGIITSAYIVIRKRSNLNSSYFNHLFRAYDECKVFYGLGEGVRQGMNYDDLRNLEILLPEQTIQQSIAAYLDQKCGEIDELITLQEEMITKLQSYKQSVITEAVTKGLDKNVPLKDSGVEWIVEIPKHWVVKRLKYVCDFNPQNDQSISKLSEVGYLPMERLKNGYMLPSVISVSNLTQGLTFFKENDIVLAKVTPCFENGNIAIAKNLVNNCGFGSSELFVFRVKSINRKYLFYLLQEGKIKDVCKSTMIGTGGLKRISPIFMKNIQLTIPPLSEQQSIADYLDQKCSEIDELISIKQQKIEKLKEYKKSLIFECVTGKRKVS